MYHPIARAVLLLVLVGCMTPAAEPPAPPMDAAAMRDTIAAREKEWSAAFMAGDATAIANLYSEDAASIQPTGEWSRGRTAIAAQIKQQLDTINVTAREDVPEEVIVAGDHLVEFGKYSFTGTTKKGNKPVSGAGRYVVVWRKDADGAWRLYRDMGSEAPKKM
ncbi:MAG: SgcJ/EcaC family oxidoreductase [Gemmatimonadota bacterium]